jgi:hypothetical protein
MSMFKVWATVAAAVTAPITTIVLLLVGLPGTVGDAMTWKSEWLPMVGNLIGENIGWLGSVWFLSIAATIFLTCLHMPEIRAKRALKRGPADAGAPGGTAAERARNRAVAQQPGASERLRALKNTYTYVKIFHLDRKNLDLAAELAGAFHASGWSVFPSGEPVDPVGERIDGIEVRGFNEKLVKAVADALSADGWIQIAAIVDKHKNKRQSPKWETEQNYVGITVGYRNPPD